VTEKMLDLLDNPPVEEAEREIHRTDSFAFVTLHAAAGQMKCPAQVEDVLLRQFNTDVDPQPIVPLKHAGRAVAAWANLAASIAADTAVELTQPEVQPLEGIHRIDLFQLAVLVLDRLDVQRFTEQYVVDHGYAIGTAGAANLQFTRFAVYTAAGKTDDDKLSPINLLFRQEQVEGAAVARLDDHSDAGRFLPSPIGFLLVVEVCHEVMDASFAPDQPVSFGRIADEGRTRTTSRTGLVADDTVHLTILQKLMGMVSKSFSQCFVNRHSANSSPRLFPRPKRPPGEQFRFRGGDFGSPTAPLSAELRHQEDYPDVSVGVCLL
jgi:hypothetical protein